MKSNSEHRRRANQQESHRHHYVPEFLLKAWATEGVLNGYWFDTKKGELACKKLGPKAFCYKIDLLLLEQHPERRDILESKFFSGMDTRGADALEQLRARGPKSLNEDERCDIVRVLLSLMWRTPEVVEQIRAGVGDLVQSINDDPELREAGKHENWSDPISERYAQEQGHTLRDRSFISIVQSLVDDPRKGTELINGNWQLVRLGAREGTFILADRPCVRVDQSRNWYLPIDPWTALAIVPRGSNPGWSSNRRFAKTLNVASAKQAQRFVFSVEEIHAEWLQKHLVAK